MEQCRTIIEKISFKYSPERCTYTPNYVRQQGPAVPRNGTAQHGTEIWSSFPQSSCGAMLPDQITIAHHLPASDLLITSGRHLSMRGPHGVLESLYVWNITPDSQAIIFASSSPRLGQGQIDKFLATPTPTPTLALKKIPTLTSVTTCFSTLNPILTPAKQLIPSDSDSPLYNMYLA